MSFTNIDRRTVANLTIPRNVEDLTHVLRVDEHTKSRSEADVHKHLVELAKRGLVVNLGGHVDMARLAHEVEAHPKALTMPDEKAAIFARRMVVPKRQWRTTGDLWMLTNDSLDVIREPVGKSDPFTTEQLKELITLQHAAVPWDIEIEGSIHDGTQNLLDKSHTLQADVDTEWVNPISGDVKYLPRMLPQEYMIWIQAVLEGHQAVWGDAQSAELKKAIPKPPMGGGSGSYSDTFENRIVDQENQKTLMPSLIDPWFMALSILAFTDADTGTTADDGTHVPTYTGWGRKSVAASLMAASSAGSSTNTGGAITFAACTGGSSTILGAANCSTVTTGEMRKYASTASTTISTTQTPATISTSGYTTAAD